MNYCPACGQALETRSIDGTARKACRSPGCGFVHWDNPVPVVAALVEYRGKVVLARNEQWPEGLFSLITGYLERDETPEAAVLREVKEELGLDGKVQALLGCHALTEKNQVILAHWVTATGELTTGSEIAETRLVSREELAQWPFGRLALTSAIVRQWLETTAAEPRSPARSRA